MHWCSIVWTFFPSMLGLFVPIAVLILKYKHETFSVKVVKTVPYWKGDSFSSRVICGIIVLLSNWILHMVYTRKSLKNKKHLLKFVKETHVVAVRDKASLLLLGINLRNRCFVSGQFLVGRFNCKSSTKDYQPCNGQIWGFGKIYIQLLKLNFHIYIWRWLTTEWGGI